MLQLRKIERALCQWFALGLIQLASNADQPGRGGEKEMVGERNAAGR